MPRMTRSHYNLVADAACAIIKDAANNLIPQEAIAAFQMRAAGYMTAALAGTNSQFKADRFRERCLGLRKGPR